jgi:glucan biosynthesis protein C
VQRIHFLDVARALLMLLGIPFHAALVYETTSWLISSPDKIPALTLLPAVLSAFRMPGFFLIAGFFAALLLERRTVGAWLRSRMTRLGLPLLTGIVVIVPLQTAILRLGPLAAIRLPSDASSAVLSHLWFLPVLMMLCLALAASWRLVVRIEWPDLPVWALGILFGLWMVALRGGEMVSGINLALLGGLIDLEAVLGYLPFFFFGVAARRNPAILARLTRPDRWTPAVGLVALAVYCLYWQPRDRVEQFETMFAGAVAALCVMQALLAFLARRFDRPSPLVDRLVDASFTIYLFHHPIVVALAIALLPVHFPPLLELVTICIAAMAISYAIHRAMMRSSTMLMLFNGVMPRQGRGLLSPASEPNPS